MTDERRRIESDTDQLRDLGEHRRPERRGDRRDDRVGALGCGLDGEHTEGFEIDVEVATVRAHTELHDAETRRADRSHGRYERIRHRRRREMPSIAGRDERFVGRARSGQDDLDRAVSVDHHGQDLPFSVAQLVGSRADRDVDAEQPLVRPDRAQAPLGRE